MYVHIGGEYSISDRFIVGIFDMDMSTAGQEDTLHFLTRAEKEGRLEYVSEDLPRSFVLTVDRVYISPVSSSTIKKRMHEGTNTFGE